MLVFENVLRIFYFWFLIIFHVHVYKCDDVNITSILRKRKFAKRDERQSYFDEHVATSVETKKESAAFLICIVNNITNETVSWIRNRDLHILTVNNYVYTGDTRFEIINETPNNWTLKINYVRNEDAGEYECQISTQPVSSFSIDLTIYDWKNNTTTNDHDYVVEENKIAGGIDLVNDEETEKLPRENFKNTKILEGSKMYVKEGKAINITCEVNTNRKLRRMTLTPPSNNHYVESKLNLIWFHNNEVISENTSHDGTRVITKQSSKLIRSKLFILHSLLNDSGDYVCHAFKFNDAVITVYVTSGTNSHSINFDMFLTLYLFSIYFLFD